MPQFATRKGLATLIAALAAGAASADVTYEQSISIEAGGMMSMLGASGTSTTSISGDRARSESKMEPKSKMMAAMSQNMDTTTIIRLDKDLMWNLVPSEEEYSEVTFDEMRAQMQQSMAQMEEMQGGGMPVDDDACQWSEAKVSVEETGEKERIAGERAEQFIVQVSQTCTVPNQNKSCDMTWTMDHWLANRVRGDDEARDFQRKMAQRLGMDEITAQLGGMAGALMAMYGEGWDDAFDKARDLGGFPVRTTLQMEIGGEACTLPSGTPIAMDEMWTNAFDAAGDAALYSAAGIAGAEVGSAVGEAVGGSVGGRIAGSAIGAASREVIGGMFSKLKKKKDEPEEEAAAAEGAEGGGAVIMFRIKTEMTDIDTGSVPDSRFEVPGGWTRVDSVY